MDCVRAPVLSQQGVTGSCSTLCGDGTGDAFEAFHSADSIRVDASACGHHLHTWPCPGGDADFSHLLQPVDIALRPGSTDHKVFIQVRSPSYTPSCVEPARPPPSFPDQDTASRFCRVR